MSPDVHQRARTLLDRLAVEGISAEEQRWLDAHIAHCAACSRYAGLSERAVRALDHFAIDLDPEAVFRIQQAVRARAAGSVIRPAWLGGLVAILLTVAGSLAMWQTAAWLAGRFHLPSPGWQLVFIAFWLLPSLVLNLVVFLREEMFL